MAHPYSILGMMMLFAGICCLAYIGQEQGKRIIYALMSGPHAIVENARKAAQSGRERIVQFADRHRHNLTVGQFLGGVVCLLAMLFFTLADLPIGVITWTSLIGDEGYQIPLWGHQLSFDAKMLALASVLMCAFFGFMAWDLAGATDFFGWSAMPWKRRGIWLGLCLLPLVALCWTQSDLARNRFLLLQESSQLDAAQAPGQEFGNLGGASDAITNTEASSSAPAGFLGAGERASQIFAILLPLAAAVAGIGVFPVALGIFLGIAGLLAAPFALIELFCRGIQSFLEAVHQGLQSLRVGMVRLGGLICMRFISPEDLSALPDEDEMNFTDADAAPIGTPATLPGSKRAVEGTPNGAGSLGIDPSPSQPINSPANEEEHERDSILEAQEQTIQELREKLDEMDRERQKNAEAAMDNPISGGAK